MRGEGSVRHATRLLDRFDKGSIWVDTDGHRHRYEGVPVAEKTYLFRVPYYGFYV